MNLRPPVLSGSWYPAAPDQLSREVDGFLAGADMEARTAGRAVMAVCPHAGYAYSGPSAGRLFGQLAAEDFTTIILLAPNHRIPLDHIALSSATSFGTPLGEVQIDTEAVTALADLAPFRINDQAHAREHAVEILLPFIQRCWPAPHTPRLVPMLVPRLDTSSYQAAGQALDQLRKQLAGPTLLLVSSDFTHFGEAFGYVPFHQDIPQRLEQLDSGAVLRLLKGDPEGLLAYGRDTGITMCGLPASAVALFAGLPEGYEASLVDYCRSGDLEGDYSHSVSYAAVLFTSGKDLS
jgi:AmmeMemoRadiSam system protein B|nr:AmmeMemoRadiSam system protein B [Candidatus Krumholzibacteria bacterium]